MIVTIDGPAGSGKSTVARQLAIRLGVRFLDTGAMYRAVALAALNNNIDESNDAAVEALASQVEIQFSEDQLLLNGQDATDDIRRSDVTAISSICLLYTSPSPRDRG